MHEEEQLSTDHPEVQLSIDHEGAQLGSEHEDVPTIYVNERFERIIFGDKVDFSGHVTSGHNPEFTLNGQSIPWQDIDLIAGDIPAPDEPSSLMFFTALLLKEGINEVSITATGSSGAIAQRTVYINSDQTTPDSLRSIPAITDISVDDFSYIRGSTTVTFTVENSNIDSTTMSVFDGSEFLDILNIGGNNYSFVIESDRYLQYDFAMSFDIMTENKWGNTDSATRFVFLEDWYLDNLPVPPTEPDESGD